MKNRSLIRCNSITKLGGNLLLISILFLSASFPESFKERQLRYPRVREAYEKKGHVINDLLQKNHIDTSNLRIYLRAFKLEKKLELWAKNGNDSVFRLLKEYDICRTSGVPGPKRKRGDLQIPEGFYHINIFNPASRFHLSLGINYPNRSDRILGEAGNLGGDIFIHGACATIGCLPVTDDKIREIYILCIEAKNAGQDKIPVTIYPAKLNDANFIKLISDHPPGEETLGLWTDLKKAFGIFNQTKRLPEVTFLGDGRHRMR